MGSLSNLSNSATESKLSSPILPVKSVILKMLSSVSVSAVTPEIEIRIRKKEDDAQDKFASFHFRFPLCSR